MTLAAWPHFCARMMPVTSPEKLSWRPEEFPRDFKQINLHEKYFALHKKLANKDILPQL